MDDLLTIFKSGMWRLYYKLSPEGRKRFFNEFFPLLHDTKYTLSCLSADGRASVLGDRDEKAWYLVYIGTRPDSRGKGYARKLVEHITTKVRRTPVCRNQPGSPTAIPICYQDDADR